MKHFLVAALLGASMMTPAFAHHAGEQVQAAANVTVSHAYTFENADMAHSMRVYLTITNGSEEAVELTGASVGFAENALFEAQAIENGSLVTAQPETITVNVGQTLTMQPGGAWIELESVQQTFEHGEHFDLTLTFAGMEPVEIEVEVEEAPGEKHDHDHDHSHEDGEV
ncbi:copper chaperone PCu(A)C [Fulvimarina sp. MAC3]|uniref:copper chaperone PCu(A)C n=1 Tax=Fulvimarina sp. MAC3 TaxID=3148887 RepID=UPI0031FBF16D